MVKKKGLFISVSIAVLVAIGVGVSIPKFWPMPHPFWQRTVKPGFNPIEFLIERVDRPIAGVVIKPQTTAELKNWFQGADENHVPRVFVDKMPKDFKYYGDKKLFAAVISALILKENEKIIKERAILAMLAQKSPDGKKWTPKETEYFDRLVKRYDSRSRKTVTGKIADLAQKVNPIPPLMAVIQAAEATDWGRKHWESPFEQTGWIDAKTFARVPFKSLIRATESYALEMNGMPPLNGWRYFRSREMLEGSDEIGSSMLQLLGEYKPSDLEYREKLMDRWSELDYLVPDNLSFIRPMQMPTGTVKIGPHSFKMEFAKTLQEKQYGLMYRPEIPQNTGMIFVNERPDMSGVWMKNTFVPLDVIFFGGDKKVTQIFENLKPLDETPHRTTVPSLGMVELPAGTVQKYKIKVGDKVSY